MTFIGGATCIGPQSLGDPFLSTPPPHNKFQPFTTPPPNEISSPPNIAPVTTTLTTTVTKSTPTPTTTPSSGGVTVTVLSPINVPTSPTPKSHNDCRNIMIIGIVFGVVGFLLLGNVLFLLRRRKKRGPKKNKPVEHSESNGERSTTDNIMSDESSNVLRHNGDVGQSRLVHNPMLTTPFQIPNSSLLQPVVHLEGEEDRTSAGAENFPRRLSTAVHDGYFQNDAVNPGSVPTAAEVLGMLKAVPPPNWRPNSTMLPDERWHADSGVRLGGGTLLYDEANSEWSLRSKDRLPPQYTQN